MKFALVNTEPEEYNRVVSTCWVPMVRREGDEWEEYRAYEGQLPPLEQLSSYDGFALTGSSCCPLQGDQWIQQLSRWMEAVVEEQRRRPQERPLRLFASCFSCQLTAVVFGGSVAKNFVGKYVSKAETVRVRKAFLALPFAAPFFSALPAYEGPAVPEPPGGPAPGDDLSDSRLARVWESHGYLVDRLPTGAVLYADSPSSPNEIYMLNKDYLAVQGHPEWSVEEMEMFVKKEKLPQEEIEEGLASIRLPHHCDEFKQVIRAFLHADDVRGTK